MQVTSDMRNKHATFGLSRTCSMYGDVLEVAVNVGHCQVLMYCDFQIVNLIHYCNITVDFFGLCLTRWRVASQSVTPVLADWGQRSKRSTFGTPGLARLLLLTITVTLSHSYTASETSASGHSQSHAVSRMSTWEQSPASPVEDHATSTESITTYISFQNILYYHLQRADAAW